MLFKLLSTITLSLLAAGISADQPPTKALLFSDGLEAGTTLLKSTFKPGDKKISFFETGELDLWQKKGGTGWIYLPHLSKPITFNYLKRRGTLLKTIQGLSVPVPKFTQLQTATFSRWDEIPTQGIVLHTPGLHGPVCLKIIFRTGRKYYYLSKILDPVPEYFIRFYATFSDSAISSILEKGKIGWFFETMSETRGQVRIGLILKDNNPVICLRFHTFSFNKDSARIKKDIYLYGKSPVRAGKPYCIEAHFKSEDESTGGAGLWIDDLLAEESRGHNTLGMGKMAKMNVGSFSGSKILAGFALIDDIALSTTRIGPIPAIDTVSFDSSGPTLVKPDNKITHIHCQITQKGNPYFTTMYNTGKIKYPSVPEWIVTGLKKETPLAFRVRALNKHGNWSTWKNIFPYQFPHYLKTEQGQSKIIQGISLTDPSNKRTLLEVLPETWFNLQIKYKEKTMRRIDLHLMFFGYPLCEEHAKDNVLNSKTHYYYRIGVQERLLWTHRFEGREVLYEISGQNHPYVKNTSFIIDTLKKAVHLQVRLANDASTGPWLLRARAFGNQAEHQQTYLLPFAVVTQRDQTKSRLWIYGLILLIVLACAITLIRILRLGRKAEPAGQAERPVDTTNPFVLKSLEIIQAEYKDPGLEVKTVAKKINISRSYLSSQFKKETGKSFPQYLNAIRMEKAKELLKSTDYTISEIAFRVGYGTYEHFNYIFKKHENISARDFRRQQGRTEG